MLVGAGKAQIDLVGVLPHDGFEAVHDPLHVRAIVFQNPNETRACLLSIDATSMRDDAPLRTATTEVVRCAEDDVWVTVTHVFSAPHVRTPSHLADDAQRARNELLSERLVQAVHKACENALADLVPARFETACGRCSVNANRDVETPEGWWLGVNPHGYSDRSVRIMRITEAKSPDRTVATLFTVDMQSSVVQGMRNADGQLLVSADLAGEASRILERHLGGVAVFLVGAAGDQCPRVTGSGALPELGQILSSEVEVALTNTEVLPVNSLALERHEILCPGQVQAEFHSLAPKRRYTFQPAADVTTTLSVARLGTLTIVGVEPELDSALGSRLRSAGKGSLEVLTLVNGAQKYLPSAEAYSRITYEAMNSAFAKGADTVLAEAILKLI